MNKKPPKIAEWLLNRTSKVDDPTGLAGDLEEMYKEISSEKNGITARVWYWREVIISIFPFIIASISGGCAMFKNYLKTAYRNFKRQKAYSLLNIFSLSLGLSVFILISLYVQYEFSFDKFHPDHDRIFKVLTVWDDSSADTATPGLLALVLVEDFPEIISTLRLRHRNDLLISYKDKEFMEDDIIFADKNIFKFFAIELIKGDEHTILDTPGAIAISEKMAVKYFGSEDPVGKVITVEDSRDFFVSGVFKDMPDNSHINVEFLSSIQNESTDFLNSWMHICHTYCLLLENTSPDIMEEKIKNVITKYIYPNGQTGRIYLEKFALLPLADIHLRSEAKDDMSSNNNDIRYIYIMSSAALFILMIACINYMNLATARSVRRAREIGIRKVAGAGRNELIRQFLGESLLFTFISLFFSILIVLTILPFFNSFIERELILFSTANFDFFIFMFIVTFIAGLISGIYPAIQISSFRIVIVLKGSISRKSNKGNLRNVLVVFQFMISIILITGTLVINRQLDFIRNKELGFTKDHIVVISLRDNNLNSNLGALKSELLKNPEVLKASFSNFTMNGRSGTIIKRPEGSKNKIDPMVNIILADYDFADVYGLRINNGRDFSRNHPSDKEGAFLFNESLTRTMEWDDPVGKEVLHVWENITGRVTGVVEDFHFNSLHSRIEPLYIFLKPEMNWGNLSVKINGENIPETIRHLESVMKTFSPHYPFEYMFFNEAFDRDYKAEQKLSEVFSVFSGITILIACLGLIGLAAFIAEQKTKEIGTRKVLGATIPDIFGLLSKDFLKCVLIANVIAVPVIMFFMQKWLENFAYRIDIGIGVFVTAGAISIVLALLTVSIQSLKAALSNPVDSLRYE